MMACLHGDDLVLEMGDSQLMQQPEYIQLKWALQNTVAKNAYLKKLNQSLRQENNNLAAITEQLKRTITHLKKRQCSLDCVVCLLEWICENGYLGVGFQPCNPQLLTILTAYVVKTKDNIEMGDLKCGKFLDVLLKAGIVVKVAEYTKYPNNNMPQTTVDEVWEKMTTSGYNVMALGKVLPPPEFGHAFVCCFNEKFPDKVTIHDPQENNNEGRIGQDAFRQWVASCMYTGIELYGVDLNALKVFFAHFEGVLHIPNQQQELGRHQQATGYPL